ncbi:hypothetical protein Tco_0491963 [Tanacetum coccineum]
MPDLPIHSSYKAIVCSKTSITESSQLRADELSPTYIQGPRALIPKPLRCVCKVYSGLSSLRLTEGSSNGGDEVGTDIDKGGSIPNDGASSLVGESMKGGSNSREWQGSGQDHGESGDDGRVDIARSLATSASDHTGVGTGAGIEILAVTRYAGCGGGVAADSSVSNGSVSSADGESASVSLVKSNKLS